MRFASLTHEIKLLEPYANSKLIGDKTFEIRVNDRGYQKGDVVIYQCVDGKGNIIDHPINDRIYLITYVTSYMQRPNYVVYAEKDITDQLSHSNKRKSPIDNFTKIPPDDGSNLLS